MNKEVNVINNFKVKNIYLFQLINFTFDFCFYEFGENIFLPDL